MNHPSIIALGYSVEGPNRAGEFAVLASVNGSPRLVAMGFETEEEAQAWARERQSPGPRRGAWGYRADN
jgi:hypothetical protein